jgi:hypothetical protein
MGAGKATKGLVSARWRGLVAVLVLLVVGSCGILYPSDTEIKDNLIERWPEFVAAMAVVPEFGEPSSVNPMVSRACLNALGGPDIYGISVHGEHRAPMSEEKSREVVDTIGEAWRELGHDVLVTEEGSLTLLFEGAAHLQITVSSVVGFFEVLVLTKECAAGYGPELLPGYVLP